MYYVDLGNVIGVLDLLIDKSQFRHVSLSGVFNCLYEEYGRSDLNVIFACASMTCVTVIAVCGNVIIHLIKMRDQTEGIVYLRIVLEMYTKRPNACCQIHDDDPFPHAYLTSKNQTEHDHDRGGPLMSFKHITEITSIMSLIALFQNTTDWAV